MHALRLSPRAFRGLSAAVLAALVFIIVTGGAVRLTGSGLGCSDWPTCENNRIVAPLEYHAMVEFVNRTITGLVSVAVILAVLGSLFRGPRRRDLVWLSLGLVAGVVGQIVLGGITVKVGLAPPFVMGHFLVSIALVFDAVVLLHRAGEADPEPSAVQPTSLWGIPAPQRNLIVTRSTRTAAHALVAWSGVVLLIGTAVTGTGPHGGDERVERLPYAIAEVTRLHSFSAWLLLLGTLAVLWRAYAEGSPAPVRRRGGVLVAVLVAQGMLGYAQYALGIPVALVGLHICGAVAVFIAVLWFDLGLTSVTDQTGQGGPTGTPSADPLRQPAIEV